MTIAICGAAGRLSKANPKVVHNGPHVTTPGNDGNTVPSNLATEDTYAYACGKLAKQAAAVNLLVDHFRWEGQSARFDDTLPHFFAESGLGYRMARGRGGSVEELVMTK